MLSNQYLHGSWNTFSFLLDYLNTLEDKTINKKDLYSYILSQSPTDVAKYMDKLS